MKQRSIGMCILLTIVTCGIYGLYWFVCITDDTNELADERDLAGGGMALLLTIITCNIYGWYWAYKMGDKVDTIKSRNGMNSSNSGILFVVLQFLGLGIINYALAQDCINKYSGGYGGGAPYNNGYNQNMNNQYNGGYNQNMNNQYNGGYNQNMNNQYNGGYDQNMNNQQNDSGNTNNPYSGM
jgi:hypothetical protein